MKLALLFFGIFITGIATILFFCLAIASSWAADLGETHQNPETTTPPEPDEN